MCIAVTLMNTTKTKSLDADLQISVLEREWRSAYEASIAARAQYQVLARQQGVSAESLDQALERLDRAEAQKAKIMLKIEQLEDTLLTFG